MNKSEWMKRWSMATDIATRATTKIPVQNEEQTSKITKTDIAMQAKTWTSTVNFKKNTQVKSRTEIKNTRIGNQENTDHLKFKVKLLNIQTCNHRISHRPWRNLSSWNEMRLDRAKIWKTNLTRTGWKFITKWIKNIKRN